MKAMKTFWIGAAVLVIGLAQFAINQEPFRLVTVGVGVFFIIWGWKIGWTRYRALTVVIGHLAVTIGCLVTAYGAYLIPFQNIEPTIATVLDLPLFWGLFTMWGGNCMITHGYCSCAIRMHEKKGKHQ